MFDNQACAVVDFTLLRLSGTPVRGVSCSAGLHRVLGYLFLGIDSLLPLLAPGTHCSFLLHHTHILPLREVTKTNEASRTF